MTRFAALLLLASAAHAAGRPHVAFVNIGEPAPFWSVAVAVMRAAAEDLDVELEVLDARGDHLAMIDFAAQVAARAHKPDYLIVNNEKQVAGRMLEIATAAGIPVFLFHNVLVGEQVEKYGRPREKVPLWIGQLTSDNEQAGYSIAAALLDEARGRFEPPFGMIAIGGGRATPVAMAREAGLARAAEEHSDLRLFQLVHCPWNRDKARRQIAGLLRRYPTTRLIWAANDPMALGAMDAVSEVGRRPGKDVLIGGLNWSTEAVRRVRSGELVTSVGGHFMGGAWALVLLRDHHDGLDFAPAWLEGVFRMGIVDKTNAAAYLERFSGEDWRAIDFRRFSRSLNPRLRDYDFSLRAILEQAAGD